MRSSVVFFTTLTMLAGPAAHAQTASAAQPQTWNAAESFAEVNPNGPWSYWSGSTGTSMQLLNTLIYAPVADIGGSFAFWKSATDTSLQSAVRKSLLNKPFLTGTVLWPVQTLLLDPAAGPDAIVCWTAPATANYQFNGFFEILDTSPHGVATKVFVGTTDLTAQVFPTTKGLLTPPPAADGNKLRPGKTEFFFFTRKIAVGTKVCFGVGTSDGNSLFDSTGFQVIVTKK